MGAGIAAGPHFRQVIRSAFLTDAIIGPAIPRGSLRAGSPFGFCSEQSGVTRLLIAGRSSVLPNVHFRAYPAGFPIDPVSCPARSLRTAVQATIDPS
jgi:hypothetical protein